MFIHQYSAHTQQWRTERIPWCLQPPFLSKSITRRLCGLSPAPRPELRVGWFAGLWVTCPAGPAQALPPCEGGVVCVDGGETSHKMGSLNVNLLNVGGPINCSMSLYVNVSFSSSASATCSQGAAPLNTLVNGAPSRTT